jgi:hypothetical protein
LIIFASSADVPFLASQFLIACAQVVYNKYYINTNIINGAMTAAVDTNAATFASYDYLSLLLTISFV